MKVLKFYGVSDDLFEMEGDIADEIGCYDRGASYLLEAESGSMIVYAIYAPPCIKGATWVIGIALKDEGVSLPDWNIKYETAPANGYPDPQPYSPMLIIEAPNDVRVIGQEAK